MTTNSFYGIQDLVSTYIDSNNVCVTEVISNSINFGDENTVRNENSDLLIESENSIKLYASDIAIGSRTGTIYLDGVTRISKLVDSSGTTGTNGQVLTAYNGGTLWASVTGSAQRFSGPTGSLLYYDGLNIVGLTASQGSYLISDGIRWTTENKRIAIGQETIADEGGIAIGIKSFAGFTGSNIAIGSNSAATDGIAIGDGAKSYGGSISVGKAASSVPSSGLNTISIGNYSREYGESKDNSIAIGTYAGSYGMGKNSIALGNFASFQSAHDNVIIIDGSGSGLNSLTGSSLYISPIRKSQNISNLSPLYYNSDSSEVVHGSSISYTTTVAVGVGTSIVTLDDITWNINNLSIFTGFGVAWNGSLFVAVGQPYVAGANQPAIATSPDGINWTPIPTPYIFGRGIAYNGSLFVAVSSAGSSIITSPDGINWSIPISPLSSGFGVVWSGSHWVVVGQDTSGNNVATSPDGINWTAGTLSVLAVGYGIAWNGSLFVAVGQQIGSVSPAIVTSPDGLTWTDRSSSLSSGRGIAWNGSLWIAVGYGKLGGSSIVTSPDGINWTNSANDPFPNVNNTFPQGAGMSVVWTGSRWLVVSGASQVATSLDGSAWTVSGDYPAMFALATTNVWKKKPLTLQQRLDKIDYGLFLLNKGLV